MAVLYVFERASVPTTRLEFLIYPDQRSQEFWASRKSDGRVVYSRLLEGDAEDWGPDEARAWYMPLAATGTLPPSNLLAPPKEKKAGAPEPGVRERAEAAVAKMRARAAAKARGDTLIPGTRADRGHLADVIANPGRGKRGRSGGDGS